MTKLYDIPRESRIYGLEPDGDKNGVVIFHRLDGMYSYCHIEGKAELGPVHLAAVTPLVEHEDGYRLAEDGDD